MKLQNRQINLPAFLATLLAQGVEVWPQGDQLICEAPEELLTPTLLATLKTHKAEILTFLTQSVETQPLAEGQQALWLEHQLAPQSAAYNVALALRIHCAVDVEALQLALQRLVNRHPALRTTFTTQEETPRQQIHAYQPVSFQLVEASGWSAQKLAQAVLAAHQQLFALETGPLFRTTLFTNAGDASVLLCSLHHLITDGWSSWILLDELAKLYGAALSGESAALPLLATSYLDYMDWQREFLQREGERLWDYWRQQLSGTLPVLNLPSDHPRPPMRNYQGDSYPIVLANELTQALGDLARTQQTTLYTLLLAVWQVLLYRYSGQTDLLVGSALAGRSRPEFADIVGYFTSPVVMRAHLAGNPPFAAFLQQVRHTVLGALEHQDYPFARLVERLQLKRDPSVPALYQVSFALQQSQRSDEFTQLQTASQPNAAPLNWAGMPVSSYPVRQSEGQVDLFLELYEGTDALTGHLRYDTALFAATTIARIAGHLQTLLQGILANPQQPIGELPMLTETERQQILVGWNDTAVDFGEAQTIHALFEQQVAHTPAALAVVFAQDKETRRQGDREIELELIQNPKSKSKACTESSECIQNQLTYAELNARANQLAHYLIQQGVGSDVLVGICVERSLEMIVGLLGIFKAGGAYLPLDPTYPPDRLLFMLQDAAPSIIVTQSQQRNQFPPSVRLVCLDADAAPIAQQPAHNPCLAMTATELAYVIYTSGSSGQPKGVLLEHGGLVNLARAQIDAFGVQAGQRVLQVASLNFDASISEIVMALGAGATLVVATADDLLPGTALTQTLQQQAITHVTLVPTALALLDPAALPHLQTLIVAGEACPAVLAARWAPGRHFFNAYGPTETTVCATIMDCATWQQPQQSPPIGRPLANTQVYLLDQLQQPLPIAVPGELYIGGAGVARGYHNRPELTTEKFIASPFGSKGNPGRLYKSGDLARWLPDGTIEYLGRLDQQVKLRGFRIELGEIEAVLRQHPAVQEAVVIAREEQAENKQLVAYVVAAQADEATQREHVTTWQSLYEDSYSQPSAQSELSLNLTGWNSSYTGEPIAEAEMSEWVANTVAEIRSLHPQRVLEIGCGSGLLLARLAPACAEYWGMDYAHQAIAQVARLRAADPALAHVQLAQRMADDFSDLPVGRFDCVILNSVVQYFPSVDYLLGVLAGALRLIKPGGKLYVGDVRNYRLLAAYHASVQRHQATAELALTELQTRIHQHIQDEEELLIDPAFFHALPQHLPAIGAVEVRLKRGRYHNELTRFRYQVILHIADNEEDGASEENIDTYGASFVILEHGHLARIGLHGQDVRVPTNSYRQETEWSQIGSLAALQSRLPAASHDTLVVRNIPNARVQADLASLAAIALQHPPTVGQLNTQLASQRSGQPAALDPADLWALGDALSYQLHLTPSANAEMMDAYFTPTTLDSPRVSQAWRQSPRQGQPAPAWPTYTNNPLLGKLNRTLVPKLRSHLQSKLPEYMLPAAFVLLDALPLTPNGKVDRKALPAPSLLRRGAEATFVPPRTATERRVAAIWSAVLGLEQVGLHDNFFDLGGHSLLATQIVAQIRQSFAVALPLRTLFTTPTVAANAQAVAALLRSASTTQILHDFPPILAAPAQRYDPFPLTDVQHAYWIGRSEGFELGNVAAHGYFELDASQLDSERLNQAWQTLINRHEMLRAIVQADGQQRILASVPDYRFAVVDLSLLDEVAQARTLAAIRAEMSHQMLPTEQWPLFDIRLTHLGSQRTRVHVSLDGLILDGSSLAIVFREWIAFYQNPALTLKPLAVSFRDYVLAEKAFAHSPLYQQAWDYWRQRLDSLPPAPDLPLRLTAQSIERPHFNNYVFTLAATRWARLKAIGKRAGITDSTIILSAFAEIIAQWSKRPHFTLNLTLFNRLPFHPQIHAIMGDFTPLLLLEIDARASNSFQARAERIQQQLWDDLDHQVVNGVQVLRELAKRQGLGANRALMPVVFTSMLATDFDPSLFRPLGELGYSISQTPQVWLDHGVSEVQGALQIHWNVVEELFPAGMVADMFAAYCDRLEQLASNQQLWLAADPVPLQPQQLAQRNTVNASAAPLSETLLPTLFLRQVERQAAEPAVITAQTTLTYQELYQRANQVGHWLREQGVKPNTLVAVVMEKGWEQVVAVLGIHLAGAAYLPIDPTLPSERQHYLLRQGEVAIALTQSHLLEQATWPAGLLCLAVDRLTVDSTLPPLEIVQQPTDLAYVIYTSGSTGQPKGVMIDQRGAVNTVLDINRRFAVTAQDRVLALSALNFDLSVYDIFGLLAVGGTIVMPDPDLRSDPAHWVDLMVQHGVTLWDTVPALMQMLVDYVEAKQGDKETRRQGDKERDELATLHLVMLSGDWIPVTLPDRIKALWTGVTVYGLGGATEASIWSNYFLIEAVDPTWPSIPYGKPLTNQSFQVLDADLNPRPVWVPGDLYIGGIGLALGYWKDKAKSNERFIVHPRSGERLYKTGDLARYLPDGNLEFLGREDFQVKIRGHRIELGEIESALLQHPAISEAVVSAVGDAKGNRQLVVYVVANQPMQNGMGQNGTGQIPDGYSLPDCQVAPPGFLTDPVERLAFKLRQPGLRTWPDTFATGSGERPLSRAAAEIQLPNANFDPADQTAWLARQSYRHFTQEVIPLNEFSRFLRCLLQMPLPATPLPKYRYPSAGNLYPVQSYLYVKPQRIEGLPGGFYYHQPATHRLLPLGGEADFLPALYAADNQAIFAQAAFALFLVADLAAIEPLYGEAARDFALLEAGYMSQLLMSEAVHHQLGLCPIGGLPTKLLQASLALHDQHQLLHSLVGGRIDPLQQTQWSQNSTKEKSAGLAALQLQQFLKAKLPDYMLPNLYIPLVALPLTPNGKVDRKALPDPTFALAQSQTVVAPRSATEQLLAAIWRDLLKREQVSIDDDFFTVGGDSLLVTQVLAALRTQLQITLPLRTLFEKNTIADLAEHLDAQRIAQQMTAVGQLTTAAEEEEETW